VNWKEYELAFCFSHGAGIGSAAFLRRLAPHIKIVTIPEPPPLWMLQRRAFKLLEKMVRDLQASDVVGIAQECNVSDWRGWLKCKDKAIFLPLPINIPEYENFINMKKRRNIIAASGHCNYKETSRRSWKIIEEAMKRINKRYRYKTGCFYVSSVEILRKLKLGFNEAFPWTWKTLEHIPRLNQCKIFVDDNICPASGHMALEMACLGIPSVGSNDYISHLFPELSMPPIIVNCPPKRAKLEVTKLANDLISLANDKSFYKKMVGLGKERLYKVYSYESCKKRLMGVIE
jgi:hypothetical protein